MLPRVSIYDKRSVEQRITFPEGCRALEDEILRISAALVIIDPISAFLPGSANVESIVRRALGPLTAVAERTKAAIVLVRHLQKVRAASPLFRGAGSVGVIAVARSGLLVGRDPVDPERRVIAQFKSNVGPCAESLGFRIVKEPIGVRVEWLGVTQVGASQLVAPSCPDEISALDEACDVLYSILGDGPVRANEVKRIAVQAGVSQATLGRAKRRMAVKSRRKGFGANSSFLWVLPKEGDVLHRVKNRHLDELVDALVSGDESLSTRSTDHPSGRGTQNSNDAEDDGYDPQPA